MCNKLVLNLGEFTAAVKQSARRLTPNRPQPRTQLYLSAALRNSHTAEYTKLLTFHITDYAITFNCLSILFRYHNSSFLYCDKPYPEK